MIVQNSFDMQNLNKPSNWDIKPVKDLATYVRGVSYKKALAENNPTKNYVPILRATNIQNDTLILDKNLVYVPPDYVKDNQLLRTGDLVICMSSGSKELVGKAARLQSDWYGSFGTFCGVVRPSQNVDNRYLWFFFLSPHYRQHISKLSSGVNINNLRRGDIEDLEIPLAPLPEQRRLVAKIEELFSQLDAGLEALKRAQAKLKRYKASVLKAACEGRLVPSEAELAREEGRQYEPAGQLLKRIGRHRGHSQTTVTQEPYELPEGWTWATLGTICDSIKNGVYKKKEFYSDDGVACLRMYNIFEGAIVWKNVKRMRLNKEETFDYGLHPGDILMNRVNSRELVGKSAVIPKNIEQPLVYESKNMRIRFKQDVNSSFVNYWLMLYSQSFFNVNAQQVVGMASINQSQVARMPIPVAPINEQKRIVSEVEAKFSIIEQLSEDLNTQLVRMEKIRNSVLKKAFEGKLFANSGGHDE